MYVNLYAFMGETAKTCAPRSAIIVVVIFEIAHCSTADHLTGQRSSPPRFQRVFAKLNLQKIKKIKKKISKTHRNFKALATTTAVSSGNE